MDPALIDQRIRCPYCGERLDIVIDVSAGGQSYVEDCAVCCRPIEISFETSAGALADLRVSRAD
ncbi:MAG TPA: CPXCG motif-containing cysteine-rich protein [Woeseiaceae bacterium]|nr:CPXCG motif-containing cysteine-rich protein [Woeseiaceae bacterium]